MENDNRVNAIERVVLIMVLYDGELALASHW